MIDVSKKWNSLRSATAQAIVRMKPDTIKRVQAGDIPKGDPLAVAKVAATLGVKHTSTLIPYCHSVPIDHINVSFEIGTDRITITVFVKSVYHTGVEMDALTGASVAALTIYDMLKMIDEAMEIEAIRLVEKRGGKSDYRTKHPRKLRAAVVVMSDSIASGKKDDQSGKMIVDRLEAEAFEIFEYKIIPDDPETIVALLSQYADNNHLDLVVSTGGTGFSFRDNTPEATEKVIEREIPGIPEILRQYGQDRTPYAMLSRGKAGIRGNTIIINLPGSKRGVAESLDALFPGLHHSFAMLEGGRHDNTETAK